MSNYITIKLRRGTAAQWTSTNPVLAEGEFGAETDTRKFKIGNGVTAWNSLQYWGGSGGGAADFTDLGDVPASYTGQGGKYVKVKSTADGLEFGTLTIAAADLPTGIDAAKIGNGTVSNTEFQTLNGAEQPFTTALKTKLDGIEAGADVTDSDNVGSVLNAATAKTTPVDADTIPLSDSAAAGGLKKLSWANLKATAKAYFDTIYAAIVHTHAVADIVNVGHEKLIGRHGAGTGAAQEVGIDGGLEFHGGNIRTSAITGDVTISAGGTTATISGLDAAKIADGTVSNTEFQYLNGVSSAIQTQLDGKVDENAAITPATKTKITYDAKGLVTAGADATTADIADSSNKRYVTDAQLTVIGNTSGTNTGDQTITLTGDVTGSGTGSFAATIANDAVTNAKLAEVATATFKGRTTAGTGNPEDLTGTQATALLDTFTSSLKGLAPASGGGTSNFLRADGTWAAPSGGGSGTAITLNRDFTQKGPSNTTTKTAIYSFALPTDLAAGDTLMLHLHGTYLNNSGSAQNTTLTCELGATTLFTHTLSMATSSTINQFHMQLLLHVVSTTSQKISFISASQRASLGTSQGMNNALWGSMVAYNSSSENLTTSKTLQLAVTLATANANYNVFCEGATLIKYPAP